MQIAILANEDLKNEMITRGAPPGVKLQWLGTIEELLLVNADVYVDLLFEKTNERIGHLGTKLPKPVFINEVTYTLAELGLPFIRLNAWPGFLKRNVLEIAVANAEYEKIAAKILSFCQWPYQVVPDITGMISARVISMIVNEAYFALGENVSTKKDIDIAMKLGTNYPFGPFEWSELIGLDKIYELLFHLSLADDRYIIADALSEEMNRVNGE